MIRFILVSFAFMGWGFYELSGGADFDPSQTQLTNVRLDPLKGSYEADTALEAPVEVTRVALNLTSVEDVLQPDTPNRRLKTLPIVRVAVTDAEVKPDVVIPSLVENAEPEAVLEPEADPVSEVITTALEDLQLADTRTVTGNRVNVRGGPGTDFSVVAKLVRDDEVEVVEDNGSGWVRIRFAGSDETGWIADFLLSEG